MEANPLTSESRPRAKRGRRSLWTVVALVCAVVVTLVFWHGSRGETASVVAAGSAELPTVAVARVAREDLAKEITMQAEFRPFQEIDLHAKVSGFVEKLTVDIGDRVEEGQLLATLEVPELRDDLEHAEAAERRSEDDVKRAEAASEDAKLNWQRLAAVDKAQPRLVAQQEMDNARNKALAAASEVAAARQSVAVARADLKKFKTIVEYSNIKAPFAGVITKRYADPGALIQAGTSSSTQAMPLVRLSENDKLRLAFPVSAPYVAGIRVGDAVEVRVESLKRTFTGVISRFSHKVETDTRTMQVETDVPNTDLTLVPGMYATVVLKLDRHPRALAVPIEAVSQHSATTVFVVNAQHRIEQRTVKLGLETPAKIEILSGLSENELVIISSRSTVRPGQRVEPKLIETKEAL